MLIPHPTALLGCRDELEPNCKVAASVLRCSQRLPAFSSRERERFTIVQPLQFTVKKTQKRKKREEKRKEN